MHRRLAAAMFALILGVSSGGMAQQRPAPSPPAPGTPAPGAAIPDGAEIKLDESATLKAVALEARMSAVIANFALLQRQAQDLQAEMAKMLEERKHLIEEAGKRANVEVKNPNEWAFDSKGQRYVHGRAAAPAR
jgi:hypothetical protein